MPSVGYVNRKSDGDDRAALVDEGAEDDHDGEDQEHRHDQEQHLVEPLRARRSRG